jgi:hypothetical protein
MVVVCPNCHTRLRLTRLPCAQCKNPIEVDANLVAGKPVMICPQCKAQQVIGRLKCTKCQTMINLAGGQKPPAPAAAPQAAAPSAAAPVAAAAPAADPPAPSNRGLLSVISFLIPVVGLIVGVILLTKQDEEDRKTGKRCLECALFGFILASMVIIACWMGGGFK